MTSNYGEGSSPYRWAPLVFARTHAVDYHLIAMPKDFRNEEIIWIMPYILGTFEKFTNEDSPPALRWSVVKRDTYCVIGLTCMAYQVREEHIQDQVGRRGLQVFLGYVLHQQTFPERILPGLETTESLLRRDNAAGNVRYGPFSELYSLVEKHWEDNDRQAKNIDLQAYDYQLQPGHLPYEQVTNLFLSIHNGKYRDDVLLFAPSENKKLWALASQQIASQKSGNFSLCLGLSRKSIAQQGPFVNATAYDSSGVVGKYELLPRNRRTTTNASPPKEGGRDRGNTTRPNTYDMNRNEEELFSPADMLIEAGARFAQAMGTVGAFLFSEGPSQSTFNDFDKSPNIAAPPEGYYRANHPVQSQERTRGREEMEANSGLVSGFKLKNKNEPPIEKQKETEQDKQVAPPAQKPAKTSSPFGIKRKPATSPLEKMTTSPLEEAATPQEPAKPSTLDSQDQPGLSADNSDGAS